MGRLVRTIKCYPRFIQSGRQRGPGFAACLPKLFFGLGGVGIHALCGRLGLARRSEAEAFSIGAKLVSGIAPRFQLSVGLAPEDRLLVLDLFTEALDILVYLSLKCGPLRFELRPRALPPRWSDRRS